MCVRGCVCDRRECVRINDDGLIGNRYTKKITRLHSSSTPLPITSRLQLAGDRCLIIFSTCTPALQTNVPSQPPRPCPSRLQLAGDRAHAHALHNRALSASTPLPITSAARTIPFFYFCLIKLHDIRHSKVINNCTLLRQSFSNNFCLHRCILLSFFL